MTVGQLEQRLKKYPRETTVLILAATDDPHYPNTGIKIKEELVATFIRPDTDAMPSTLFLVPAEALRCVEP